MRGDLFSDLFITLITTQTWTRLWTSFKGYIAASFYQYYFEIFWCGEGHFSLY